MEGVLGEPIHPAAPERGDSRPRIPELGHGLRTEAAQVELLLRLEEPGGRPVVQPVVRELVADDAAAGLEQAPRLGEPRPPDRPGDAARG
jgi:hypothetical protein